jgi:hypothetical protein
LFRPFLCIELPKSLIGLIGVLLIDLELSRFYYGEGAFHFSLVGITESKTTQE